MLVSKAGRNGSFFLVFILMTGLVVAGIDGDGAALANPFEIKLASESAVGTPGEKSGRDFAKLVEEKTSGKVKVRYYPAGQLGTGDALTEAMQTGSVDMAWRVLDWYAKFEKGWNIMLLGFLFKDGDHVTAFLNSSKHKEFRENLTSKAGIRILSDNGIGSPRVLISKTPVRSPNDMQGMKMRVPNIEMYVKTWSGVGVNVVQVPWGEAYMALKQGVVDALESPLGSIYGMKFHEAAKNITLTNHVYSIYVMAMNENSYKKIPSDIQKIMADCADEGGRLYVKYDKESVDARVKTMVSQGVKIIDNPDIDAFQKKLAPLAEELEKKGLWPSGLYGYIQSLKR
jgi:tripartite ATP-independent transporter DctP family solute receptor